MFKHEIQKSFGVMYNFKHINMNDFPENFDLDNKEFKYAEQLISPAPRLQRGEINRAFITQLSTSLI